MLSLYIGSYFTTPTDSTDVYNINSSFSLDKTVGAKRIPTKILKMLDKDIRSIGNPIC